MLHLASQPSSSSSRCSFGMPVCTYHIPIAFRIHSCRTEMYGPRSRCRTFRLTFMHAGYLYLYVTIADRRTATPLRRGLAVMRHIGLRY